MSKFSRSEWSPCVNAFYGDDPITRDDLGAYVPLQKGTEFQSAWKHHMQHNRHHWQNHIVIDNLGGIKGKMSVGVKTYDMTDDDITEMLCDWTGAAKAQGKEADNRAWYLAHKEMWLSEASRIKIESRLYVF